MQLSERAIFAIPNACLPDFFNQDQVVIEVLQLQLTKSTHFTNA